MDEQFLQSETQETWSTRFVVALKAYKGAKYGIPDLSCCYRDDGALRVNHSGLPEAPRMVIANPQLTMVISKEAKMDLTKHAVEKLSLGVSASFAKQKATCGKWCGGFSRTFLSKQE